MKQKLIRTNWYVRRAAVGFCALATCGAFAQTWQTVDDFQYFGQGADAASLAVAPSGVIFAAGSGTGADGLAHALITASADDGVTWSAPLDDFINAGAYNAYYNAVACDPLGHVYGAGYYYNNVNSLPNHWAVRASADGGATWSTVDDYQDGWYPQANAVASDSAGNIFVAGYADGGNGTSAWLVRRGLTGGNFTTVDRIPTTYFAGAQAIFVHPTAGIFAAGPGPIAYYKTGKVSAYGWLVRRSTDGGTTWASVDSFALSSGYSASAQGIGADAFGNLYAVGFADAVTGSGTHKTVNRHWIVRKSTNGGGSWSTVDNYVLSTAGDSGAKSFAADSNGNLFVAGWVGGTWLVRENPGGAGPWSNVDTFTYVTGAGAAALAANASGNIFAAGFGSDSTGTQHWLVRKR